jgi:hypothetical protein
MFKALSIMVVPALVSLALPASAQNASSSVLAFADASLAQACPATVQYYPVKVDTVHIQEERIDQGQIDRKVTVVYEVTEDRGDNVYSEVTVELMEYDLSNPAFPSLELLSVSGLGCHR